MWMYLVGEHLVPPPWFFCVRWDRICMMSYVTSSMRCLCEEDKACLAYKWGTHVLASHQSSSALPLHCSHLLLSCFFSLLSSTMFLQLVSKQEWRSTAMLSLSSHLLLLWDVYCVQPIRGVSWLQSDYFCYATMLCKVNMLKVYSRDAVEGFVLLSSNCLAMTY